MLVPCPLCFNRLKAAVHELEGNGHGFRTRLTSKPPKIWDLANFFATDEMLEKLAAERHKTSERSEGCLLLRVHGKQAPGDNRGRRLRKSQSIDKIVKALGAESIDWPYKTDCCGASLMVSRSDMGFKMVAKMLEMAKRVGAQAVVVSCQMCQGNLDMYQDKIEAEMSKFFRLPVIYFTELIGLAHGLPGAEGWLSRHFVDPIPVLRRQKLDLGRKLANRPGTWKNDHLKSLRERLKEMKDVKKTGAVAIIGGGIAGIQSALDIANSGFKVYLIEKKPNVGGVMAQLDKTFPTNDCSSCMMGPKLVELASHRTSN